MEKKTFQGKKDVTQEKPSVVAEVPKSLSSEKSPSNLVQPDSVLETHAQETVEDSKFYMAQQGWPLPMPSRDLAYDYGDNRIVLMPVDSFWAFSYWEVTKERVEEGLRFLGCSLDQTKTVLRVYDVTGLEGTEGSHHHYDVELSGRVRNWYLNLNAPDHSFRVDIGLRNREGRFFTLARSNTVTMPRAGVSDVVDERWMSMEFEKMYALSGGLKVGEGSIELRQLMEKRFQEGLSSGALSSFGSSPVKKMEKSFWFVLDTELVVYGATEPDAHVTVAGQPVQLRPDGTFTLRLALPDGRFPISAKAESSDGREERTITPVVQRNTEISQPVLKS
ncbi:MAG: DUF4912 domain-containing protein [Chlamydiae bacterium]|nr:DUF4912 domain-containing protein [Chlamydiota bacterium]